LPGALVSNAWETPWGDIMELKTPLEESESQKKDRQKSSIDIAISDKGL
uniref:Uncharacterized protein n=2 Tax=Pan TaxID=9596 RepID=A0A2I3RQJ6_PANTR